MTLHSLRSGIAVLTTLLVSASISSQTTLQRDSSGRIVITDSAHPAPAAPAAPAPVAQPVVEQAPAVAAPAPAMTQLPFSLHDGDASTAALTLASFAGPIAVYKGSDGAVFASRSMVTSAEADGPFPYVPPSLARVATVVGISGDIRTTEPRPNTTFEGAGLRKQKVNLYFGSDRATWKRGVPVFEGVRFRQYGNGIDVTQTIGAALSHFEVSLAPGPDRSKIQVTFSAGVSVDAAGWLTLASDGGGRVAVAPPHAWQSVATKQLPVQARWKARDAQSALVDFATADPSLPVDFMFDVSRWTTAQGTRGGAFAAIGAIASDAQGNVWVAGPALTNVNDVLGLSNAGSTSTFQHGIAVARFDGTGKLAYTTILGSAQQTPATVALAPDGHGNVFVAITVAGDAPVMRTAPCGANCAGNLVAKLGAEGELLDSSLISSIPQATAMAVDSRGITYVVAAQPTVPLADDLTSHGFMPSKPAMAFTGYAAKIDPFAAPGGKVLYATYLGGVMPSSVAFTPDGRIVVGGTTGGQAPTPPPSAYGPKYRGGGGDGYLFVFDPAKSGAGSLVAATYIGGGGEYGVEEESVSAVAVDEAGNVYAAGLTGAPDFPTSGDALQRTRAGESDGFVCKLDPQLKTLRWSTLIGGNGKDRVTGIGVDHNENVYVVGDGSSTDFKIEGGPTASRTADAAAQPRLFLMRLNSLGSSASWSLQLAGDTYESSAWTTANLVAAAGAGDAVFALQPPLRSETLPFLATATANVSETFLRVASCRSCSAAPSIDRISQSVSGAIVIEGSHFDRACKVLVDDSPAPRVNFVSEGHLEVPAGNGGSVEVTVLNPDGQSATSTVRASAIGTVAAQLGRASQLPWKKIGIGAFFVFGALAAVSFLRRG